MSQTVSTQVRRRRRWWLAIVLAVIVGLPAAAVLVAVTMFDADSAKPRIVAAVKAATGRDLVIAGPIRLVPSLHPSIELSDASLSNPDGFSRPQMAVLKRLDFQVALWPLLSRRIEIDQLVIHGADILLEMNSAGSGNWRFQPEARPAGVTVPAARPDAVDHGTAPVVHIDRIEIDDGQIAYRNPKMASPVVVSIRSLTLAAGAAAGAPVDLSMTGAADNTPITLSGTIGPSGALFENPIPPLNVELKLGSSGAGLSVSGAIADVVRLSGVDLRVAADIPDLAAQSGLAHAALPALKGIVAQARLSDLADRSGLLAGFVLRELKLALPQAALDGEVSVTRSSPPLLQGTLHASRIDVDALRAATRVPAAAAPATVAPPGATAPPAAPAVPRSRLIPDRELPLDALHAVDADLNLAVDELIEDKTTYRDLAGRFVLKGAALRVDPFTATIPGGAVRMSVTVDAAQAVPPVGVKVSAPSLDLAPLLAGFRLPPYAQGNVWLDADLHGAGRSTGQLAATLGGEAGLSLENAQVDTRALGEMLNSVEMLRTGKSGFTALRCLAARAEAKDGAATIRALLLDTSPVRLSGTGGLNLADETLALRLQTTVRMGGTGIGAPLNVSGTFLAPKVKIDAAMPAAGGGGGNAPFGLVIGKLGLEQLVQGSGGDSCAHELAIARGETPAPEHVDPAGQAAPKPLKPADLLRQLLR